MGDPIIQANRLISVETNAGTDVLLLDSVSGVESISRPFRYVLNMMSEVEVGNPEKVFPHQLVGTAMTVTVTLTNVSLGETIGDRYLSGLCESFVQSGRNEQFAFFSATIVPWLSFLNYATNCRIFQDMAVTDIISEVVADHGYSGMFRLEVTKTYTQRDYCVQYRETDFAFISRLMEDEGIYYYFEHNNGNHVMVLADDPSCYKDAPIQASFKYAPEAGQDVTADSVLQWRVEEYMSPGMWTTRDYHHEAPNNFWERSEPSTTVAAEGMKFEAYDYPSEDAKIFNIIGDYSGLPAEAEKTVRTRIQKEESSQVIITGTSKCRAFTTGYKVGVTGGLADGSYLLTNISQRITQQPAYRNRDFTRQPYENSFTAIDAATLYVPPRVTGRALVHGLQPAFVIDETPSGDTEEIWPDMYGRVKVRFRWDREAKYACWVRVVQPWAGNMWGQQWIPRIGDEVAISFMEGDPDCPVVIGSIYNKNNMPIFTLPDNKTQSGVQTHSSPGGGASDFNMLRFEDKIGNEEIYIQAQKDWNSLIKNNETRTIQNNRTSMIQVNDSRTVQTGDDTISVQQGNRTITVQQNISEESKMGNISVKADVGNISTQASVGSITTQASVGSITIQADAATVTISGMSGVTISCGASSIEMTPASISISAPMVLINS